MAQARARNGLGLMADLPRDLLDSSPHLRDGRARLECLGHDLADTSTRFGL